MNLYRNANALVVVTHEAGSGEWTVRNSQMAVASLIRHYDKESTEDLLRVISDGNFQPELCDYVGRLTRRRNRNQGGVRCIFSTLPPFEAPKAVEAEPAAKTVSEMIPPPRWGTLPRATMQGVDFVRALIGGRSGIGGIGLMDKHQPPSSGQKEIIPEPTIARAVSQLLQYLLRKYSSLLTSVGEQVWMQLDSDGMPTGHAQPMRMLYIRLPAAANRVPFAVAIAERDEGYRTDEAGNPFADFFVMYGLDSDREQGLPMSRKYSLADIHQAAFAIATYLSEDENLNEKRVEILAARPAVPPSNGL